MSEAYAGKLSPNMGSPLTDSFCVASSCNTSQCSARRPSSNRTNVGRNPGRWPSHPGETAMRDDMVALCDDQLVFIPQRIWRRADKSKQPVAPRRNVRAVLDVRRRPEEFCCCVVAFVEERIEGFEN